MSDITKCKGTDCLVNEHCYRYTAKANEYRQSYFVESPIKDGKCEMFWGKNNEHIHNILKDIVSGKSK